jgi:TRAP-type transport system periplasmic protein
MVRKVVVLVFVLSLLCSTYSAADVIKLKFANFMPIMHINVPLMEKFCKEVNEKLAGKVEVTQYPAGTLLTAPRWLPE